MAVSFNTDTVRRAWESQEQTRRNAARTQYRNDPTATEPEWRFVQELWTDFLIVRGEDRNGSLSKVPYTVDDQGQVSFGDEQPVKTQYVPLSSTTSLRLWENPFGHATSLLATKVKGHV